MKKINLRILFLCISVNAAAQSDPLREELDHIFANVDKSQVPTGFLEEYGPRPVPLDAFDGILKDGNRARSSITYT